MKNKSKKITRPHKASSAAAQRDQAQKAKAPKERAAARNARKNIQALQSDDTITEEELQAKSTTNQK